MVPSLRGRRNVQDRGVPGREVRQAAQADCRGRRVPAHNPAHACRVRPRCVACPGPCVVVQGRAIPRGNRQARNLLPREVRPGCDPGRPRVLSGPSLPSARTRAPLSEVPRPQQPPAYLDPCMGVRTGGCPDRGSPVCNPCRTGHRSLVRAGCETVGTHADNPAHTAGTSLCVARPGPARTSGSKEHSPDPTKVRTGRREHRINP